MNPGASQRVPFLIAPSAADIYSAYIDGLSGQFEAIPTAPPAIAISELFICTNSWTAQANAENRAYFSVENCGTVALSGTVKLYHWEEHWGDPPGEDKLDVNQNFNLAPGETFRYHNLMWHRKFEDAYIRLEVVINNQIVLETPYIYYVPGKKYTGGESIAVGECTHKVPGMAVLWYSQRSSCKSWEGSIRTPLSSPYAHKVDFDFGTGSYNGEWWSGIFIPIIDSNIVSGATYKAHILGGGAGAAWRSVDFTFVAA